ncbi:gastrula zinc finger protein XlCGF57.1-like isoform X1 [Sphaeramia orbicularis]|uniref:gastrula zinc finger protein XlCGF57.1-like isoform X1 n=1 Tax=Sphaeramia orbicularis TaxID=375764 RepID=UPI001180A8C2|nr:gastrula zinc finger protein XlCGF57.1-like isoform X1 [Sphaeramia orbicularis]XP_030002487.1 gastrula zinc finger protein XlCGF57.1-like isoform X1 [Sphaeramia orbicularis]
MSLKGQILRSLVEQRLTAAAEEIFGLFERTIAEYEEELCRTKEENQRQKQILDCVWNQKDLIDTTDIQQPVVKEEVLPEQQEWNPSLDQEEPECLHIKEELEEPWSSQEALINKFPSTSDPMKNEDDEGKAQSLQLHQRQTEEDREEADGQDCGGTDVHVEDIESRVAQIRQSMFKTRSTFVDKNLLERYMDPQTRETLDGSECGAAFSQTTNLIEVPNTPKDKMTSNEFTVDDVRYRGKQHQCSVCGKTFDRRSEFMIHMRSHTGEKPFGCSVCGKRFASKSNLSTHMKIHTGEKSFVCSVCGKRFTHNSSLFNHVRIHTGVREFSCLECGKRFNRKSNLLAHMKCHTGEKLFDCSVCGKRFTHNSSLFNHVRIHTGVREFGCSECGKRFNRKSNLLAHMKCHTGEKPFSCSVCLKHFKRKTEIPKHMKVHTRKNMFGSGAVDAPDKPE